MIPQLITDLNNVQGLVDEPNDVGGLTPTELKAVYDKAGNDIKTYLNSLQVYTTSEVDSIVAGIALGQISDNSITDIKLSNATGQLKDKVTNMPAFQIATGTGTLITLSNIILTTGQSKTFIASVSNNGVATTINGKPLYKPNTVIAPNLTTGKAYTVWYNLASDCFFLKASAEGDATVADVLAPKTFSNGDDTGLVGTLALTGNMVASDLLSGKTGYGNSPTTKIIGTLVKGIGYQTGTVTSEDNSSHRITVTGLPFTPSVIILEYLYSGIFARKTYVFNATFSQTIALNGLELKSNSTLAETGGFDITTGGFSTSVITSAIIHWKAFE